MPTELQKAAKAARARIAARKKAKAKKAKAKKKRPTKAIDEAYPFNYGGKKKRKRKHSKG